MDRRLALPVLRVCLILAGLVSAGPGFARPDTVTASRVPARYVPGTDDVPLMPGLAADEASAVVFEKPEGRIVEAAARGAVTRRAVVVFYETSLPQLGWRRVADAGSAKRFERDDERLSLDFDGSDGKLEVAFTLAPR